TQEVIIYNPVDDDTDEITYTEGNLSVYVESMEVTTRSGWPYDDYFSSSSIYHDDSKIERGRFNTCAISFNSDLLLEYYTDQITASYFYPPATDILASKDEFTAIPLGTSEKTPLTTGAHYFYVICNTPKGMFDEIVRWFNEKKGVLTKDEFETYVIEYPIDSLVTKFEGVEDYGLHSTQRCMMTNIVSPSPDYMASKDQNSTGSYPSSNNAKTNVGKVFAKASLAYIPETEQDRRLTDVSYKVINLPKSIYFMPNIFNGRVETPHYNIDFTGDFDACYEEYFDKKYKLPDDDNENWLEATTSKDQTDKTHVYCMENGNKIPLQGNSTFLLVKAKYNPEIWLNKDGSRGTAHSEGTFWRIKRAGYYTADYYNEEPDAAVVGSGTTEEYPEGITYYPIWLQTDGKYEVRRNGFYKIALTQVFSAGAPSLESVIDPLAPLEESIQPSSLTRSGTGNFPDITTSIQWQQGGI
ncbi:MAG: hypothetical protein LUD74_01930, partial [Tannerellaceae bacterium]|nr:hypothetical protein [Tannerellaceae bacterium]